MGRGDFPVSLILKALDKASAPLKKIQGSVRNLRERVKHLNNSFRGAVQGAEALRKRLAGVSRGLRTAGRNMTFAVTLPMLAFGAHTLKVAGDFELAMNSVQALSGATGESLSKLRDQAKRLGSTTEFTASQAGDAMGFLARAGFNANQILGAMPATLDLASAAQLEMGEAADIVSNVMSGYRIETSELGRATDILTKGFTSANTDLRQLGQAFKFAGPVASAMKLPLEQTVAVLSAMGNAGIQASMAGTSLRNALVKIAKPTAEAQRAFTQMGIRASHMLDDKGNVRNFIDVLRLLEKQGASTSQIIAIFGQRAGPAVQALLNQGVDSVEELNKVLEKAEGTTQRIAGVQRKGFVGQMRGLASAFEGLQLAIADTGVLKFFTSLVDRLAQFTRWLSTLNPAMLRWGFVFGLVVAAVGPLLTAVGIFLAMLPSMSAGLVVLTGLMSGFSIASLPITGTVLAVVAAIGALGTAGYFLWKKWEPVKKFFMDMWDTLKRGLSLVPGAFSSAGNDLMKGIGLGPPAAAGQPAPATAGKASSDVRISFENAPRGTRVIEQKGDAQTDISLGYSMVSGW